MTRETSREGNVFDFVFIAKNMVVCFLISVILLALCALVLTFFPMEKMDEIVPILIVGICTFAGGYRQARRVGRRGIICGGISGVVYMALLYLIGAVVLGDFSFNSSNALSMVIGIGCGAIGGMLGINKKTKIRRKK